jgi:hypothetical protein
MIKLINIDSVLSSKITLKKYLGIILKNEELLENEYTRKYIPSGVKSHLINEDCTGETIGCGCDVCLMRYALRREQKKKDAILKELSKLKEADKVYQKVKDWKLFDLHKVGLYQTNPRLLVLSSIGTSKQIEYLESKLKDTIRSVQLINKQYNTLIKVCEV